MPIVGRGTLKGYFNTGDVPSESNFIDLIDSLALATDVATPRVIYAADYGADGNVSTDASTGIAALVAAETSGGVIYFGPGIHRFSTGATVNITNKFLLDVDPAAVLWIGSGATVTFRVPQAINVRWFGAIGGGAATGTGCTITSGSDQLTIDVNNNNLAVPFKVGGGIVVPRAGVGSAGGNPNPLYTRIKAISGSTFTLEHTASQTVLAGANVRCLSDESIAFNDAIVTCFSSTSNTPRHLYVPADSYQIIQPIKIAYEFAMIGEHRLRTMLYQAGPDAYHWPDCILRIDSNVNLHVTNLRLYNDSIGTCVYTPKRLAYTLGNTYEPKQTDVIFGMTSGAQATFTSFDTTSGTWAGSNAAGTFYFPTQTGTFVSETLAILKYGAAATVTTALASSGTNSLTVTSSNDFAINDTIAYLLNDGTTYQHNVVTAKPDSTHLTLQNNHTQNVPSGRSVYILQYKEFTTISGDSSYGSQLIDSLFTHCWFAGHGAGFSQASAFDVLASTTTVSDCAIEMLHDGVILRGASAFCHIHDIVFWSIENQAVAFLGQSDHANNVYSCQISNINHSTLYTNGTLPCTINIESGQDIQISNAVAHNHMSGAPIDTSGLYAWTASGVNNEYYLTYAGGTVANVVVQPHVLFQGSGTQMATGTIGSLGSDRWAWGAGALGYSTIWVKMADAQVPASNEIRRMWYSDAVIRLYLCNSIKIDGLTAENIIDVPGSGNNAAIVVWGGTQQTIRNLYARNRIVHPVAGVNLTPTAYMHHGIWAQAVTNFHVSDFYIENTDQEGIEFDTSGTNVTVEKGYIKKTGIGAVGTYASFAASPNPIGMVVRDVYFDKSGGSTYALDLSSIISGRYFMADSCHFDGNTIALFNTTPNTGGKTEIRNTMTGGGIGTFAAYDATPNIGFGLPLYKTANGVTVKVAFTSGGVMEILPSWQLEGGISGAYAYVVYVDVTSGTWAGGNAAGTLYLYSQTGTFQAEDLTAPGHQTNICTIGGNTTASKTPIVFLDNGYPGQTAKVVINDINTAVDFTSTNLIGNDGQDWDPTTNDYMTCTFDGTNWYCDVSHVAAT